VKALGKNCVNDGLAAGISQQRIEHFVEIANMVDES
jgi:hypothetical protein